MSIRSWFDNPVFQRYAWIQFKRGRSPMAMLWPATFTALLFGVPLMVPDAWFGLSSGDFALRTKWSFGLLLAYVGICTLLSAPSAVSMAAAQDRAAGLLHAIRLTPQSATTKVLGYCIGPALRPYSNAILAVPFMLFATLLGATTPFGFVQIIVVIVTTSLLANLFALHIALAARMPEPGDPPAGPFGGALGIMRRQVRPQDVGVQGAMAPFGWCIMAMMAWQAGHPAVGAVTPIPTLAGCFFTQGFPAARWNEISLFGVQAPTSVLTVLAQSTLAFFFFRAATRVIQDEGARGLTRQEVFLMFASLAGLEVATLWEPIAGSSPAASRGWGRSGPGTSTLLYGYLCVMGVLGAFFLRAVSTNPRSLRRAWRRARARGRTVLEPFGEGQPSLLSLLVLGGIASAGYATLLLGALAGGDHLAGASQAAAAPLLLVLMLLVLGGVSQLSQLKPAAGGWATGAMFVLWALLPFVGLCLQVAELGDLGAEDLLTLFPLAGLSKCVGWAFDETLATWPTLPGSRQLLPGPFIPIVVNSVLAAVVSWAAMTLWARRSEESRLPPADPKPPPPSVPLASPAPAG